jgi:hypothetical protein
MRGREIVEQLQGRSQDKCFIKWWRRENDFSDYELIENFLADVRPEQEFADYRLLSLEEMWAELQKVGADRVRREKRTKGEVIVWEGGGGSRECPFTGDSVLSIFDVETRGNVVG